MGTRTYYRDSHGRFHGSAGAAGSSVGRAGGFAVTGSRGRSVPTRPTGSRFSRSIGAVRSAQRAQFHAIGRGARSIAAQPGIQRIVVRSAIVGGVGLAASVAGRRTAAGRTRYAPSAKAIGGAVKVVRMIAGSSTAQRAALSAVSQPKALGMGPKGRAAVRARKRRNSKLYSGS